MKLKRKYSFDSTLKTIDARPVIAHNNDRYCTKRIYLGIKDLLQKNSINTSLID